MPSLQKVRKTTKGSNQYSSKVMVCVIVHGGSPTGGCKSTLGRACHTKNIFSKITRIVKTGEKYVHTFNGPLSGTTQVSRYHKGKPIWILLKQETVSGSGISWAICKSAPRSRQITTSTPHHSSFTGRMPFLPPNQQRQSTEGTGEKYVLHQYY